MSAAGNQPPIKPITSPTPSSPSSATTTNIDRVIEPPSRSIGRRTNVRDIFSLPTAANPTTNTTNNTESNDNSVHTTDSNTQPIGKSISLPDTNQTTRDTEGSNSESENNDDGGEDNKDDEEEDDTLSKKNAEDEEQMRIMEEKLKVLQEKEAAEERLENLVLAICKYCSPSSSALNSPTVYQDIPYLFCSRSESYSFSSIQRVNGDEEEYLEKQIQRLTEENKIIKTQFSEMAQEYQMKVNTNL